MRVPNLNRRVQFQSQTTTTDAMGQPLPTWNDVYECWAAIEQQSSQLIYSTAEFMSKTVWRITIRWTSSVVITPQMRIIYVEPTTKVTHTFEISALNNVDQQNHMLICFAYELGTTE